MNTHALSMSSTGDGIGSPTSLARLAYTLVASFLAFALEAQAASFPLLHPTDAERAQIHLDHLQAPRVPINIAPQFGFAPAMSLLPRLPYVPAERNQGGCGNCWAWAGTGVMEIAQNVQYGVRNRLSVQFINSCNTSRNCCDGGWLDDVAGFYGGRGFAIPWSNPNADWRSGGGSCSATPCGSISTANASPISRIARQVIPTWGVGRAAAIANIKAVLNQNRAIWFGFFMSTGADWNDFSNFWRNQPESTVWRDFHFGKPYGNDGGGHAVLCVGYDETDPANPYWIMVNSWGTTAGRPNGVFRVSMNLNYDGLAGPYNALYWQTLDVRFAGAPSVSLPDAVDAPSLTLASGGSAPWTGQTMVNHDGVDAAASGTIGHNQDSWMQTTVTGPGTLSYWWKVSSEANFDRLLLSIDGRVIEGISGSVDWKECRHDLGTGSHVVQWKYSKDLSLSTGLDRGWVDLVSFAPQSRSSMVYVDKSYTGGSSDGSLSRPFQNIPQGQTSVVPCGTVRVKSGRYNGPLTLNKCLTLEPYGGRIVLGEPLGTSGSPTPNMGTSIVPNSLPEGGVVLRFSTQPGLHYRIQTSVDLKTWTLWKDFIAEEDTMEVIDPDIVTGAGRFFRLQIVP